MAQCQDVNTTTDPGFCSAAVSVNDGSFDPDGGPVTLLKNPPSPYPVGESVVTLRVTDVVGLTDYCVASVAVVNDELPIPSCNATPITPPKAALSFQASVSDDKPLPASVEITGYECFKFNGGTKQIDKRLCRVAIEDDTIHIRNTGGVGTHIAWTLLAQDENGNEVESSCEVTVGNPGR